jgi:chloramphenicol-sensitive protein RarD
MSKTLQSPDLKSAETLNQSTGVIYAILAYGSWGLLPLYWKLFVGVPASEVLCHRIIWSALLLVAVLGLQGRWKAFQNLRRSPRILGILFLTASLLALNWGTYIYGVNVDRVVETSLGDFINPLFSVLLGFIFLKEKLNSWQILAVCLAALGVGNFIRDFGAVPWIALALTFTFGSYALIRKITPVAPMIGLAMETLLISPFALLWVSYEGMTGAGHFGTQVSLTALLVGCGIITSLPLLWFNKATKQLPLSTLGFLQYLAPSLQLILGVFLYHEPFTRTHAISFGLIWAALGIYSTHAFLAQRILSRP